MKKAFSRKSAIKYARENEIEIPLGVKDVALIKILKDFVGETPFECTECSDPENRVYVQEPDVYCWYCGDLWEEPEHVDEKPEKPEKAKKPEKVEPEPEKVELEPEKVKLETEIVRFRGNEKIEAQPAQLDQKVEKIKKLEGETGAAAWEIGGTLQEILAGDLYREKYETFDAFCKDCLEYRREWAYGLVRVHKLFDKADAQKLGVKKLVLLADKRLSTESRQKLLAEAVDGNLTCEALNQQIGQVVSPEARLEPSPSEPKKKKSPLLKLVGVEFVGRWELENEELGKVEIDEGVFVYIRKTKDGFNLSVAES